MKSWQVLAYLLVLMWWKTVYYHRIQKLTISEAARKVYDQVIIFWTKSRLPIRDKKHIVQKIKDLFGEQVSLMKNRSRNNEKDQINQKNYSEKLDQLFDISHANAEKLIKNDEDRQFLKMQQDSRKGCIGSFDRKLALTTRKFSLWERWNLQEVHIYSSHFQKHWRI